MRPALKFLKHHSRGLKHLKHGHGHVKHGKGLPETINSSIGDVKRMMPLKFKNLRI